ncbi:hypothetical protein GGD50_005738 [Rhizobium paranaense]|uniref:Uncharacterized protein n=1 Tax=Rhizobium paranaense TaxID=1650438 RepID=A0A7W8XXB3_9HYPH|nr:hypothetical protein [Rhizobium paranaense]
MTLIRPPPRPRKTNKCPHIGSRFNVSCTISDKPGKLLRLSVWPVASQTFTPAGTGIITDPAHNREYGEAPPSRCRCLHGHDDRGPDQSSNRSASGGDAMRPALLRQQAGLPARPPKRLRAPMCSIPASTALRSGRVPAPSKELAHVDAGRTDNLGKNRTRLKAGGNQRLFVLARAAPTARDRRDHFNRMLGHRTTPSVCTRTSDVRINLARRLSPWAYVPRTAIQSVRENGPALRANAMNLAFELLDRQPPINVDRMRVHRLGGSDGNGFMGCRARRRSSRVHLQRRREADRPHRSSRDGIASHFSYPAELGRQVFCRLRQSVPLGRYWSCAGAITTVASTADGHIKPAAEA